MKTKTIFGKKLLLLFATVITMGCSSDDDASPQTPTANMPSLNLVSDTTSIVRSGQNIEVELSLDAEAGNQSLVVNQNGGFLEEISMDASATNYTYSTQSIPDDAEEGETFTYEFILVDVQGQESTAISYTASAAVYDMIDLGGASIYAVDIPENGGISAGRSINFIQGRDYYISGSLDFESGSSFTVEEGVQIYIDADNEDAIRLTAYNGATIDIQGTESAPVVMTSSRVLTGEPEPGDWGRFELELTQNAILRYLRIEYAVESLRLDQVDDSNTIEYVQSYRADGEGFYATDGNVNLKYLVNTKSNDTGFRLGDAYNGMLQFIINQGADHDETDFYVRENASIIAANMTLLGPGQDAEEGGDILEINSIANTFKIYNTIVAESVDEDIKFDGDMPISDLDGDNVLAYSYFFNNADPIKDNADEFFGTFDQEGNMLTNPFFNNAITGGDSPSDFTFETIPGIGVDMFIPDARLSAMESFDPSTIDPFFTSVTFVGAVENAENDWTIGWVKNVDASIR